MKIGYNSSFGSISFGQCSRNLLRAARELCYETAYFPIGDIDTSCFNLSKEDAEYLSKSLQNVLTHDRKNPTISLWHLLTTEHHQNGQIKKISPSLSSFSDDQTLLSFYELDSPTEGELNVARQFNTCFTSQYTCDIFASKGVKTRYVPLGFDSDFRITNKKYFSDDRISFCLLGKFENRKHHAKVIQAWLEAFGNDRRYYLQCSLFNPFFPAALNQQLISNTLAGKHYFNINFLPWSISNLQYNDFLNSNNIVIGMSAGEGWGVGEFTCCALGKHAVILNAHGYKSWATEENSVLISPLKKVDI